MRIKTIALFAIASVALASAMSASAGTLDNIKSTGHIRLGYVPDAKPFTSMGSGPEGAVPEGYGVQVCEAIVGQLKIQLGLADLKTDWVAVSIESRFSSIQTGAVDLLCLPTSDSLSNRDQVSFSLPVFAGGNRAVIRSDASAALRQTLSGARVDKPVWRGSPAAKLLADTTFAVVPRTSTEAWLNERGAELGIKAKVTQVADYRSGLQAVLDRKADVFFGDRSVILGAIDPAKRDQFIIVDRLFTHEQAGLALLRNNDDFRLAVDTALSNLYPSKNFADLFARWFGPMDEKAQTFFKWNTPGK
jgi:polar amino acid transport system substrate-binding protein